MTDRWDDPALLQALLDGDIVGPLQVQNVEQQLLGGRATLLMDQAQYLTAVDGFKQIIGVPMPLMYRIHVRSSSGREPNA